MVIKYLPDGMFPCRGSVPSVSLASATDFDSCSSVGSLNGEHIDLESGPAAHPQLKFFVVLEVVWLPWHLELYHVFFIQVFFNSISGSMYASHRIASLHKGFADHTAWPPTLEDLAVSRAAELSSGVAEFRRLSAR